MLLQLGLQGVGLAAATDNDKTGRQNDFEWLLYEHVVEAYKDGAHRIKGKGIGHTA